MMNIKIIIFFNFLLLFVLNVDASGKPCAQHTVKPTFIRNCQGQSYSHNLVKLINLTMSLTDECRLVIRGCGQVFTSTNDVMINYSFSKTPIKKDGQINLCKVLSMDGFKQVASKYKTLVEKCPVKAGTYCVTQGSPIIEQINPSILNMMIGTINVKATVQPLNTASNAKSCLEAQVIVSKKK